MIFTGKIDTLGDDVDAEAMEVLNELNLLSESEEQGQTRTKTDWNKSIVFF